MTTSYPVTYEKGDQRRLAHTPADETKLRFEGFTASDGGVDAPKDEAKSDDKSSAGAQAPEKTPDKTVDTASTPPAGASTGPVDGGGRSSVR